MDDVDWARVQQTIQARLVLARETIAQETAKMRTLIEDGICAGLTSSDMAERSGLEPADIETIRSSLVRATRS